jgi:hypothetical protein
MLTFKAEGVGRFQVGFTQRSMSAYLNSAFNYRCFRLWKSLILSMHDHAAVFSMDGYPLKKAISISNPIKNSCIHIQSISYWISNGCNIF